MRETQSHIIKTVGGGSKWGYDGTDRESGSGREGAPSSRFGAIGAQSTITRDRRIGEPLKGNPGIALGLSRHHDTSVTPPCGGRKRAEPVVYGEAQAIQGSPSAVNQATPATGPPAWSSSKPNRTASG